LQLQDFKDRFFFWIFKDTKNLEYSRISGQVGGLPITY